MTPEQAIRISQLAQAQAQAEAVYQHAALTNHKTLDNLYDDLKVKRKALEDYLLPLIEE